MLPPGSDRPAVAFLVAALRHLQQYIDQGPQQGHQDGGQQPAPAQPFTRQPALAGLGVQATGLALNSQYFAARSEVQLGERRRVLISLLQRGADGRVYVLQRDLAQPARVLATVKPLEEQP